VNYWLLHFYIFFTIYIIVAIVVFLRLFHLATKYKLTNSVIKWRRIVLLDSLSWPWYVICYGVKGFIDEIK